MRSKFRFGIELLIALVVLIVLFPTPSAPAYSAPPIDVNREVAFDQRLGVDVPADLVFNNEQGKTIRLGAYFNHAKPVILTLNYFSCPNLCSLELDQLTGAISDLALNLGDDFDIISVSIDPRETPDIAFEKRWQYIRNYARPGRGAGWHFLTGPEDSIVPLTEAVGFRYTYDGEKEEFAHPIGLVILTPQGKVARYIYGVDYDPRDIRLALVEASENKIGTAIDQILLLCYSYDPSTGKYSPMVLSMVRIGGVVMVVLLAAGLMWLWSKDLKRPT
ncbi:MAG: SCO family protein [Chloroflexi bacterium]|nr:SCO family protein [Chloroflexota bacterium]